MKNSEHLTNYFRVAFNFMRRGEEKFYCYALSKIRITYTESQKIKMLAAQDHYDQANKLVREVVAEVIGTEIVKEM